MSEVEVLNRLQTLEGEFKLIKGQLRQSMIDVREFLQGLKVPADVSKGKEPDKLKIDLDTDSSGSPSEGMAGAEPAPSGEEGSPSLPEFGEEEPLPPMDDLMGDQSPSSGDDDSGGGGSGDSGGSGGEGDSTESGPGQPQDELLGSEPGLGPEPGLPPLDDMPGMGDDDFKPGGQQPWQDLPRQEMTPGPFDEEEAAEQPTQGEEWRGELPQDTEVNKMKEDAVQAVAKVNLLANLIRWVSVAKRDVGMEQMPVFLDTYAIGGPFSPELKDGILRLAEVVEERSVEADNADAWSRLILELHGILTGGGEPLVPSTSFLHTEAESHQEGPTEANEPVRLKLVLPTGSDGQQKEFSITLTPDASSEVS